MKQSSDRLLGIREVADLFGVDISTVRRWDEAGHLRSVRVGERGHRRFRQEEIRRLLDARVVLSPRSGDQARRRAPQPGGA